MTSDTLGLYARSVEDLELVAKVFQLTDDEEIPSSQFSLNGANVAFCKSPVWEKAGPGTRKAFDKAQELLKNVGAVVKEIELPEDFSRIKNWHANVLAGEGRASFLGRKSLWQIQLWKCGADEHCADYLIGKEKMNKSIVGHVENASNLSRKALLESYDGCARLRPVFDEIASEFDAVITPSVVDEAPVGIKSTGDAVSSSSSSAQDRVSLTENNTELLQYVDYSSSTMSQRSGICRRKWVANWFNCSWCSIHRSPCFACRESDWGPFREGRGLQVESVIDDLKL
jgi:Asp-tRNA(Asn)/Glu-tRNA(Gln) amidotransferase A subunit family amidase